MESQKLRRAVKKDSKPRKTKKKEKEIDDDQLKTIEAELSKLTSFEVIDNQQPKVQASAPIETEVQNPSYPMITDIYYGFTAPEETIEKIEPTQPLYYLPKKQEEKPQEEEETGFVFKAKNATCIKCTETFEPTDPVVYATCKHAQHLVCCLNDVKYIKESKKCFMCTKYNIAVEETNDDIDIDFIKEEEEEIVFELDNGNDPEARKRNARRKRILAMKVGIDVDSLKQILEEEEEISTAIGEVNQDIEEDYEISVDKVSDLYSLKGIGEGFSISGMFNSIKYVFGKQSQDPEAESTSHAPREDEKLTYEFLEKHSITLTDLEKCEFNFDDIYYGMKINDLRQLRNLKLKESHFETIFTNFKDFVKKYDANFSSLDDALDVVHLDWLLDKAKNDISLLKAMDIDFACLVDKMLMMKSDLKKIGWSVGECIELGMNVGDITKLKINHIDMIEMKWNLKELVDKLKLNEKQREKLGIEDSVIKFVSSSDTKGSKSSRRTK
jgi:hypothetical protein